MYVEYSINFGNSILTKYNILEDLIYFASQNCVLWEFKNGNISENNIISVEAAKVLVYGIWFPSNQATRIHEGNRLYLKSSNLNKSSK
jgi:hypothetical protein